MIKGFSCNSIVCRKPSATFDFCCSQCNLYFCSNLCLVNHTLFCQIEETNEIAFKRKISLKRLSQNKHSKLLKPGEYIKDLVNEDIYKFENLEILKIGQSPHIIGNGHYGDIFLAKNIINLKKYSIKQIKKSLLNDEGISFESIINEINMHKRFHHENIIRLYSSYETKDSFYLVMDYAPNGSMLQFIRKNKFIDEKTVFKFFVQILSAVNFLHENNFVHRDIKPENIVLDVNNNLLLCDFGLCVELSLGNRLSFCGTYEYMAPEVMKELPYNQSVDIWSIGILIYETIHGESPFKSSIGNDEHSEYNEIYKNVMKNDLTFKKSVSFELEDLIRKMLDLNKNTRIKIKDILNHPWVTQNDKSSENSSTNANSNASKNSLNDYKKFFDEKEKSSFERMRSSRELLNMKYKIEQVTTGKLEISNESIFDRVLNKVHQKNQLKRNLSSKIESEKNHPKFFSPKHSNNNTNYEVFIKKTSCEKEPDRIEEIEETQDFETHKPIDTRKTTRNTKNIMKTEEKEDKHRAKLKELLNVNEIKKEDYKDKKHYLAAIDILEKANDNKNSIQPLESGKGLWSYLRSLRCGKCE